MTNQEILDSIRKQIAANENTTSCVAALITLCQALINEPKQRHIHFHCPEGSKLSAIGEVVAIEPRHGNATFYSFKTSGKWYAEGRGFLPSTVFDSFEKVERRRRIINANDGKYPGLNGAGEEFIFVILLDESVDYGFPLMLFPD